MTNLRETTFFIFGWLIAVIALLSSCHNSSNSTPPVLPIDSVRNGDIVFRRGRSFSSDIILSHDSDNRYSHIGIVYKNDRGCQVIHAVNEEPDFEGDFDRVKIESIEKFFSPERASAGAMYHSWLGDTLQDIIIGKAMEYVSDSVRFDSDFNHYDSKELYCTELIYTLYNYIGIDITEGRRTKVGVICFPSEIIFPSDIEKNKKLTKYFDY